MIYPIEYRFYEQQRQCFHWMLECIVHIELNRLYKPLEYDICDLNESSYECVFAIVKGNATRQLIQACNDLSNEKTSCDNLLIIADAGNRDIEVDEGNQDKT